MMNQVLAYVSPIKVFLGLIVLATLMNVSFAQDAQPDPAAAPVPAAQDTSAPAAEPEESFEEPAFSTKDLFPSWDKSEYRVQGVAGRNQGVENELFLGIVPTIINLMMSFVAPLVFLMMVIAGLRFIYAYDDEEERNKAKKFFYYTVIGLMIIILSYSIMRAVYFVIIG